MACSPRRRTHSVGWRSCSRKHKGESAIIYCAARRETENLAARLRADGFNAQPYHAGLENSVRRATQERFIGDDVSIIAATIAFGLGIDKPNIPPACPL